MLCLVSFSLYGNCKHFLPFVLSPAYNIRLSGLSPFMGDTDLETMANVTIAEYDYEDEAFDKISSFAKDFIDNLLVKEKKKRMTADQCLNHEWLNTKLESAFGVKDDKDDQQVPVEDAKSLELSKAKKNLAENRDHWDQENSYVVFDSESRTMSRTEANADDDDKSVNSDCRYVLIYPRFSSSTTSSSLMIPEKELRRKIKSCWSRLLP